MLQKFTHILFDNDGVNINSEDLAMRIMDDEGVAFIKKYKPEPEIPKDFIYTTYPGTSTDKIVEALITKYELPILQIAQDYGLTENASISKVALKVADIITIETIRRFKIELEAISGVTQALQEVHVLFGAAHVALATTSREDRMDVSLENAIDPASRANARLAEFFPKGKNRYSGYDVKNKYDAAYGIHGWDPAQTIVVEDSKSGVNKAMAGRPQGSVIGTVAARFFVDKEAQAEVLLTEGAKIVISNMADLPKAIIWLDSGLRPNQKPEFQSDVYVPGLAALRPALEVKGNAPAP